MYDLFLLRHGRSLADDENKCEGRCDSPLTEIGKNQARKTAEYFIKNKIKFDKIITSPLVRARETAEIINKSQNTELIIEALLMEKDNGILAGKLKTEVSEKYPLPEWISPFMYPPEKTGENLVELHARAGLAFSKIISLGTGCHLIVSHGGLLNALARNMLGINCPVDKSAVSFAFEDNGLLHLTYNEKSHLINSSLPFSYNKSLLLKGLYGKILPFVQQESTFWDKELHNKISFEKLKAFKFAGDYYLWQTFIKYSPLYMYPLGLEDLKVVFRILCHRPCPYNFLP